jgi:hypothetical protein
MSTDNIRCVFPLTAPVIPIMDSSILKNCPIAAHPAEACDARGWMQILSRYREPNLARSIIEIAITLGPLAALWALAWAAYHFGFRWLSLLLALPAAGFLVRLFMIQHDCGHGAFFRHRLANDWVGRVIGGLGRGTNTVCNCYQLGNRQIDVPALQRATRLHKPVKTKI